MESSIDQQPQQHEKRRGIAPFSEVPTPTAISGSQNINSELVPIGSLGLIKFFGERRDDPTDTHAEDEMATTIDVNGNVTKAPIVDLAKKGYYRVFFELLSSLPEKTLQGVAINIGLKDKTLSTDPIKLDNDEEGRKDIIEELGDKIGQTMDLEQMQVYREHSPNQRVMIKLEDLPDLNISFDQQREVE